MSYLAPPRLSFLGNAYANASTANNNDLAQVYDIDTMKFVPEMTLIDNAKASRPNDQKFAYAGPEDNPGLRNWLMQLMTIPGFSEDVFPNGGPGHGQMAHWNYYGDHNTEFQQTKIVGGVQANYQPVAQSDDVLKLKVELLGDEFYGMRRGGVLVDADPYALITSQIFSGQFRISIPGPNGTFTPVLIADHPTPAYSYYINPHKNLNSGCEGFQAVSAVFQFSVDNANTQFIDHPGLKSAVWEDLKNGATAGKGLTVRFCFYDAIFTKQAEELHLAFMARQFISNPYQGTVLGSIGVWSPNELASAPPGRKLNQQTSFPYTPPQAQNDDNEVVATRRKRSTLARYKPRQLVKLEAPSQPTATLGVTEARVDTANRVVSLDVISTFPEATTGTRDKYNLGTMSLVIQTPNGAIPVGVIPNTKAIYEQGGGVVDIRWQGSTNQSAIDQSINGSPLALVQGSNPGVTLLSETPTYEVQTDNRVVYFDAKVKQSNGTVVNGTSTIDIQVSYRGVAQTGTSIVNLEYWMCAKNYINPDKPQAGVDPNNRYFTVNCPGGVRPMPVATYALPYLPKASYPDGTTQVAVDQITVPAGGKLRLTLQANRPGVSMLRFVRPSSAPAQQINPNFAWDNVDYAIVRILPFDDYSNYTDEQINSWEFMYNEVFGFYSVMYPVMSKVMPWGPKGAPNDPKDVRQFASLMMAFTDPNFQSSTLYMPISRDMSAGKRELIRRWCNLQQ